MTTQALSRDVTNGAKAKTVGLWALQIAGAAMFLMAGSAKLSGDPQMVGMFDVLGLGQWFRYLTGGIEVVSAVLLLIPGLAAFGAALLVPTMVGAILTHLLVIGGSPLVPAALLIAMSIVLYARRERLLALAGRIK